MSEILSRSLLNWLLGYIQTASDGAAAAQANRIEASHEALRERTEQAEAALQNLLDKREDESTRLRASLEEITLGRGRFDRDQLKHASNAIEDMKDIALAALEAPNTVPAEYMRKTLKGMRT